MSTHACVLHRFLGAEDVTRSPGALATVLESLYTGRRVRTGSCSAGGPALFGLSVHELHTLDAVAGGATNGRLASRFGLSPRTVATYVQRLLVKTGCPNRTAAARLATTLHLTVFDPRRGDAP